MIAAAAGSQAGAAAVAGTARVQSKACTVEATREGAHVAVGVYSRDMGRGNSREGGGGKRVLLKRRHHENGSNVQAPADEGGGPEA